MLLDRRLFLKQTGAGLALVGLAVKGLGGELSSEAKSVNCSTDYLKDVCEQLSKKWPNNRCVNIVCHGHSVPAGYFATPVVDTFNAYPHLLHLGMKQRFPFAVINVIVTAVGGENSVSGAKLFKDHVLCYKPDVLLIDYAPNDRGVGLDKARVAWSSMIQQAKQSNIKVLLLTPSIDVNHTPDDSNEALNQHAEQIRELAEKFSVGLVDSLAAFDRELKTGVEPVDRLSNAYNHPNRKGHEMITEQIMQWFLKVKIVAG